MEGIEPPVALTLGLRIVSDHALPLLISESSPDLRSRATPVTRLVSITFRSMSTSIFRKILMLTPNEAPTWRRLSILPSKYCTVNNSQPCPKSSFIFIPTLWSPALQTTFKKLITPNLELTKTKPKKPARSVWSNAWCTPNMGIN